jgi:hypothetical protein
MDIFLIDGIFYKEFKWNEILVFVIATTLITITLALISVIILDQHISKKSFYIQNFF